MRLPGVMHPPLLGKIFPPGNDPACIWPRIVTFVRNDQHPVEIGLGKFDIRVGPVACDPLFDGAAGHTDDVDTDAVNFPEFAASGVAMRLAGLGSRGTGPKPHQDTVRRIAGHLITNNLFAGERLIRCAGSGVPSGRSAVIRGGGLQTDRPQTR